jgi:hypothetical protein
MEGKLKPTDRRLSAFFDAPPAIGFRLCRRASTLRVFPKKLDRFRSSDLVVNTAHLLILMAVLKSRFRNSLRALPLVEHTDARIARTHALCDIIVLSSSRRAHNFCRLSPLFFVFFVTCPSLFDCRRDDDFSVCFRQLAMTALQDLGLPCR